ncbi:YwmB family TATA-box binding protein [Paenibacillus sp. MBLB4367]|uniref:YwmB family TATA-box binding protein n=1 Tax=Paenibacillus sp. MBLB4367 TaxID=3384767 RepID=UPI003907F6C8
MKKWLYAAILCLVAAIVAGGLIGQAGAENGKDLLAVARYAEEQMEGAKQVTIRFAAPMSEELQAKGWHEAGRKLAKLFAMKEEAVAAEKPANGSAGSEKAAYRASAQLPDGEGSVSLVLFDTGEGLPGYAVFKRELTAGRLDGDALAAWQRQAAGLLRDSGLKGKWNIAVQGMVSEETLASGGNADALLKRIGNFFLGKELERYTDSGTLSVTYSSKKLKGSVRSGVYHVSLQAALHKQSENGQWRLTIGTPVITTEY